ncbi:MAG TPA: type VI secretion system contractile sheath small subunit [Phnomibacter sp.]|nr:type VI secretion system contractile sheath small subunit [Phnomibacter sp.]
MSNYGIGGTEVKTDASEAFAEIPQNRTLMAEKLTKDPPVKPVIVHGLQTIDQVFEHYNPVVDVEFEDLDGVTIKEELKFKNLGDFSIKGITAQSEFLKDFTTQREEYSKIIKQLKTNKILKTALADNAAKSAMLEAIYSMIAELKQNK